MSGKNPLGNGKEPQAYEGINIIVPVGGWRLVKSVRAPTTNDFKYPIGSMWIDTTTSTSYQLVTNPGIWTVLGSSTVGAIDSLTGDSGGAILGVAGNIDLLGTANQITTTGTAGTITLTLPAAITAPGSLTTTTTLTGGTGITATSGHIVASSGNIVASSGNITATFGTITAGASVTASLGDITATNGNLVLGTAGNKIMSTSVASTTTAGANSFGTVTLVGGTATISTTAVTASSIIMLTRQSVGATGAAALGELSIGTIVASTSFVINAWSQADATALAATDVSSIGWMIIN